MENTQPSLIDIIISFRQQGLSNNQIIQNLQRDGYKTPEIFDAMAQTDLKSTMTQVPPQNMVDNSMQPPQQSQNPNDQQFQQEPIQDDALNPFDEKIEEIAEAIIDEKWTSLVDSVQKILDWKEKTEAMIVVLEQKFKDMKFEFDKLQSSLYDRISQYDQNMTDVGTEIKALEKVFQKILPTLTENVNELSKISKDLKK